MPGPVGVIRAIVSAGGEVNAIRSSGRTALYLAASRANVRAVIALLECGAGEMIKNNNGFTPEDEAGQAMLAGAADAHDRAQTIQLLRNAPADRAWRRRGLWILYRNRSRISFHSSDDRNANGSPTRPYGGKGR